MRSLLFAATCAVVAVVGSSDSLVAQNSTRKIRPEPSELAAKAGSWVNWREDLDAALAESKESGKPVFWYVPTLFRSPMDRQVEIDRYMMAGPFSWPDCIDALNERFIPVRQAATRAQMEAFEGLRPGSFIEPGFLVLDGESEVLAKWDEITTLHPEWWRARLNEALSSVEAPLIDKRWRALYLIPDVDAGSMSSPMDKFSFAASSWERGDEKDAAREWTEFAETFAGHPLAAKAMAEAEGHGPIVNGFESLNPFEGEGWFDASARGTKSPQNDWTPDSLQFHHWHFFQAMQRGHGGFVDSRYDFGGTDSLPNVHVAVTSLVARALLEWSADPELAQTLGSDLMFKAIPFLANDENLNLDDSDELVWAYLYRMELRHRWLQLHPGSKAEVLPKLEEDHAALVAMQTERGAWSHEYPNPFVTASVLIALGNNREHGVETDSLVVSKAIGFLKTCRTEEGAITYGAPRGGRARAAVPAGVGRMPLVEHALIVWGEGSQEALARAIEASFENEEELFRVRKYDDHASRLGYGGFFFWYDLKARWEALQVLEDEEKREAWMAKQHERILTLPEFDGCFVDSHELGRSYGTAMAWLSGL
ncbi:MAG: hypothetical protein AAF196_07205 [Planctomycetota bacterium]